MIQIIAILESFFALVLLSASLKRRSPLRPLFSVSQFSDDTELVRPQSAFIWEGRCPQRPNIRIFGRDGTYRFPDKNPRLNTLLSAGRRQ